MAKKTSPSDDCAIELQRVGLAALELPEGNEDVVASAFATDFAFSRFDKSLAKPRDVSKLAGRKHAKSAVKTVAHHNE